MADTVKYKFLDENGLLYLWTLLKSKLADKVSNDSFTTIIAGLNKNITDLIDEDDEIKRLIAELQSNKQDKITVSTGLEMSGNTISAKTPEEIRKELNEVLGKVYKSIKYDSSVGKYVLYSYDASSATGVSESSSPIASHKDLESKVDKVTGMGLSQNSYTTAEKTKLGALPDNATLASTYAKKSDITTMYRHKGSVTFANLPLPSTCSVGDVYNIKDSFSTTEYFVEGRGHTYPMGSNVVCVSDNGTKLWDVLGGQIDLSPFAKTEEFAAITNTEIDNVLAN